ncbi:MAG: hypothetical protein OHK0046_08070 [Anaerolineae bacterium]
MADYERRQRWDYDPNEEQDYQQRYGRRSRAYGEYGDAEFDRSDYGQGQQRSSRYGRSEGDHGRYGQSGGQRGGSSGRQGGGEYGDRRGEFGGQRGSGQGGYGSAGWGGYGQQGSRHGDESGYGQYEGNYSSGSGNWNVNTGLGATGRGMYGTYEEDPVQTGTQGSQWARREGPYYGHGPEGYQRSDERIREDVNERLMYHGGVNARKIQVKVENGEVTLEGQVGERRQKRMAEDAAEQVRGVKDVHNRLTVDESLLDQIRQGWNNLTGNNGEQNQDSSGSSGSSRSSGSGGSNSGSGSSGSSSRSTNS